MCVSYIRVQSSLITPLIKPILLLVSVNMFKFLLHFRGFLKKPLILQLGNFCFETQLGKTGKPNFAIASASSKQVNYFIN